MKGIFYKPFLRDLSIIKDDYIISPELVNSGTSYNIKDYPIVNNNKEDIIVEDPVINEVINNKDNITIEEDSSPGYKRFKEAYNKVGDPNMFKFFSLLAKKESGYNPSIQNLQGAPAYGYFQFMEDGEKWRNISRYGGVDINTFRSNPELQIQAAHKLANEFLKGFSKEDLARAKELGYSKSALLAGAWLGGIGGVRKFLHKGISVNDYSWSKDKKTGVDMSTRMKEFNNLFQEGGKINNIENAKSFVKDVYYKRRDILKNNIQNNQAIPIPISKNLGYNKLSRNIDNTAVEISPNKLDNNILGEYTGKNIILRSDNIMTAIHEFVHSSKPYYQIKEIDKLKNIYENNLYDSDSVVKDDYLDKSSEIYPNAMSFRYWAYKNLGYDLNHKWNSEEIDDIKRSFLDKSIIIQRGSKRDSVTELDNKDKIIKTDYKYIPDNKMQGFGIFNIYNDNDWSMKFINRFNTDFIVRVLNDIAYNDNKNNKLIFGKAGVKVPKFKVLKNSYNDSNEYYDYSNGIKEGDHWSSRDPHDGLELKNELHPTAFMSHEEDESLGYNRYKDTWTNRYYTLRDWEKPLVMTGKNLVKVNYPSYGEGQKDMESSINSNISKIRWAYNKMLEEGLNKEQAAAILGNFWKESRISFKAKNNSGAYGIAQLTGERLKAYKEYLSKNNLKDNTVNQIEYLIPIILGKSNNPHGLEGDYMYKDGLNKYNLYLIDWTKNSINRFLNGKSLKEYSDLFSDLFERPNKDEADKDTRYKAAKYIYNLMENEK